MNVKQVTVNDCLLLHLNHCLSSSERGINHPGLQCKLGSHINSQYFSVHTYPMFCPANYFLNENLNLVL